MKLKKLLAKVLTAALLVTTVGMAEPVSAAEQNFDRIEVSGTNEWKLDTNFRANYSVTSNPSTSFDTGYGLYDDSTGACVYHSNDDNLKDKEVYLDKNKTYTLNVWVSPTIVDLGSIDRIYFNNMYVGYYSTEKTDCYYRVISEGTCIEITKKIKYYSYTNSFLANEEKVNVGTVDIKGKDTWNVGDVFEGEKYAATSSLGRKLKVQTQLYDETNKLIYDSINKKTEVKFEKGKKYTRYTFVRLDFPYESGGDYFWIGEINKVLMNGKEYDYSVINDSNAIEVIDTLGYYSASGCVGSYAQYLDLGVLSIDGTLEMSAGKVTPDFVVKSSENANLKYHFRMYDKDKKLVYDSAEPNDYEIIEGETYVVLFFVSLENGNYDDGDYLWIGSVDALLVNGKSYTNYSIIDDSNAVEYQYSFIATKKAEETKKDEPVVSKEKKAQDVKVKAKAKTLKAKKAKKGLKLKKLIKVTGAQGTVKYKIKSSKPKKGFKINSKGVITLKKKLKKGSYKVKVLVTVAGNDEYEEFTKVVTVKIKVKK